MSKSLKLIRAAGVIAGGLLLLLIVAALLPASAVTATDGGIIKPVKQQTLISNTAFMATNPLSSFVSPAAFIGDFGAVQFQIRVVVPDDQILGPRVITWTPQFSIEPLSASSCAGVTQWFDGVVYQAYADASYYAPLIYSWEQSPMSARTIGSENIGFEAGALGACTRIKFVIAATGAVFTPTIYLRALNRQ